MTTITAQQEVAGLASDLIRIDTTNTGDDSGPGERMAAEHVAGLLAEVGLEPTLLESRKNRASVVARIEGEDPSRPGLLIHGHLDVVPFDPDDWRVHPLSGEISGGCVWGRGAVDMKDMDAMMLAVVRQRLREGRRPPRDIVLAFLADEEAGGNQGAGWLVDNHPELFDGVTVSPVIQDIRQIRNDRGDSRGSERLSQIAVPRARGNRSRRGGNVAQLRHETDGCAPEFAH